MNMFNVLHDREGRVISPTHVSTLIRSLAHLRDAARALTDAAVESNPDHGDIIAPDTLCSAAGDIEVVMKLLQDELDALTNGQWRRLRSAVACAEGYERGHML